MVYAKNGNFSIEDVLSNVPDNKTPTPICVVI